MAFLILRALKPMMRKVIYCKIGRPSLLPVFPVDVVSVASWAAALTAIYVGDSKASKWSRGGVGMYFFRGSVDKAGIGSTQIQNDGDSKRLRLAKREETSRERGIQTSDQSWNNRVPTKPSDTPSRNYFVNEMATQERPVPTTCTRSSKVALSYLCTMMT